MQSSCPRAATKKTEEAKKEEVPKPEAKKEEGAKKVQVETEKPKVEVAKETIYLIETKKPSVEVAKETIIPITVEKEEPIQVSVKPFKAAAVNPYAAVSDAIAAARAAELANAQVVADVVHQATSRSEALDSLEAMLTPQETEAIEAKPSIEKESASPSPKPGSPTRESGDWTMVDSPGNVTVVTVSPSAILGARPKSPPQQRKPPVVEEEPLHSGNLLLITWT